MMLRYDSGSGGGGTDTETTTSTDDSDDSDDEYVDTLDLGTQSSGGGSHYDTENNVAVVDTGDDIQEAGGTTAVLAETDDEVQAAHEAISDVTGELRDMAEDDADSQQATTTDLPPANNPDPTGEDDQQDVLDRLGGGLDLSREQAQKAAVAVLVVLALVFGG